MSDEPRNKIVMPEVPEMDFVGSMIEIWFALNFAAYHLAYVRVYLQTGALQTPLSEMLKLEQDVRNRAQADVIICRAHLAALFWQLDHVYEALDISVKRGQKEQPNERYFWNYEKELKKIEEGTIRKEISAYRNTGHTTPAIIGQNWTSEHKFVHHFLPSIKGLSQHDDTDMNETLHKYFVYTANVWLSFAPSDLKKKFPRDFHFVVSVPYSYVGELPPGLEHPPQLEVHITAYDAVAEMGEPQARGPAGAGPASSTA
jgi:hypothetical protein